jgi:methyltransferase
MLNRTARTVLALVGAQRVAEVAWAGRNDRRLRARGGVEHGAGHYPVMVALHGGWLLSTAVEASRSRRTDVVALAAYAVLQPARYWVIRSLGDRWTTRIVVVADEELVTRGPFRWFRHPNYLVVAAEIALLPLALGARRTAAVFTVLNAALMAVRIPAEERALAEAHLAPPRSERSSASSGASGPRGGIG